MSGRERILFVVTVGIFAVGLGYIIFMKMLITPAREAKLAAGEVEVQIEKLRDDINYGRVTQKKLARWASATFSADDLQTTELTRAHLRQILAQAGLDGANAPMTPVSGRVVPGAGARELGWDVKVRGSLKQVTDLLFLLKHDPQLHRIDSINWMPQPRSTDVELSFRYVTLVIDRVDAATGESASAMLANLAGSHGFLADRVTITPLDEKAVGPGEIGFDLQVIGDESRLEALSDRMARDPYFTIVAGPEITGRGDDATLSAQLVARAVSYDLEKIPLELRDPGREPYNLIASRDLFRPYIRRPPPPPAPREDRAPRVDPLSQLKLVGLPTWQGEPKIVVRHTELGETTTYNLGESLLGGEIVMVDYRPLPDPQKPFLSSGSRVIVRIGRYHWAVELGQMLSQKQRMPDNLVPEHLKSEVEALPSSEDSAAENKADETKSESGDAKPPGDTPLKQESDPSGGPQESAATQESDDANRKQ